MSTKGYQTQINETLRAHLVADPALDATLPRRILRQELNRAAKG